ncbi:NAD-dependent epimerase/dehydratase family protein [Pseudomonas arsenicoxydans]|uniref:UDP-glucose 4-epimerase n=1 Tax=Pseudomonas arsenicoxydans TaxID=702115 RepID=A0A502HKZ6_9PSED|nr:GDP-mannose 4,6-dehydratase [Pseudomonas arsenicoxydans]TPG74086.1 NAD-dependent epimerase/dehydratase family protein [Pseudomonas arsenicoxydans]
MRKTTLITGEAGYIGSHTALALINAGHHVVVLDNLCNSCRESIARLELLTHTRVDFISGMIGEDPNGRPNNLLPCLAQVAIGRIPELTVYGCDYPTVDGTCVRDYIHVVDLANGHLKALEVLDNQEGVNSWNLGTGIGYSVLQIIHSFEDITGITIPYRFAPRREGDIAKFWADPSKAVCDLGWSAERDLEQMIVDTWRWQSRNPQGYQSSFERPALRAVK